MRFARRVLIKSVGSTSRDPKKVFPPRRPTVRHHAISTSATVTPSMGRILSRGCPKGPIHFLVPQFLCSLIAALSASTIFDVGHAPAKPAPSRAKHITLVRSPPEAYLHPDRRIANSGARRACQGWPHFCGHRRLGLDTPEYDGTLDRSGLTDFRGVLSFSAVHELRSTPPGALF